MTKGAFDVALVSICIGRAQQVFRARKIASHRKRSPYQAAAGASFIPHILAQSRERQDACAVRLDQVILAIRDRSPILIVGS